MSTFINFFQGFGFVTMAGPGEAVWAKQLDGAVVEGRRIEVSGSFCSYTIPSLQVKPATAKAPCRPLLSSVVWRERVRPVDKQRLLEVPTLLLLLHFSHGHRRKAGRELQTALDTIREENEDP